MNRTDYIALDTTDSTRRRITAPFELRKDAGSSGGLTFKGYASTTEQAYPVFGGTFPGWMETMASGSFKKTLRENADVAFLINHDGLTLARTKSGTMDLKEDKTGLAVTASLDPRQNVVNDLFVASERGDIDEMSFAFQVVRDEWLDDDGNKSDSFDGTKRRILEVNLNKGDVSAVNYGANDTTSGGFREIEMALAELRDGREPTEKQLEVIRQLARTVGEQPELRSDEVAVEQFGIYLSEIAKTVEAMKDHYNATMVKDKIGPDGTFLGPTVQSSVKLGPGVEAVAAMLAHHERRREVAA